MQKISYILSKKETDNSNMVSLTSLNNGKEQCKKEILFLNKIVE